MVTLDKITSPMFPRLYEAFLKDDDPLSGEREWRDVFDYQLDYGQDHCGYALLDGKEVVGMLGMVFAERTIDGVPRRFCNLHTWWVREDHRARSLLLMKPVAKMDGHVMTHFTPCDRVRAVTKKLGFKPLSTQLRILLPRKLFGYQPAAPHADFTFDTKVIQSQADDASCRILADHLPYGCGHLLIDDGKSRCYVLYTHVVRHRLPYCHVHHVSNRDLFVRNEEAVREMLLKKHKARFVAVDVRLFPDVKFRSSFKFWAPGHAVYKSDDVSPDQIDNLYSDIVFLKLTTLPDMSHQVAQLARRILPWTKPL